MSDQVQAAVEKKRYLIFRIGKEEYGLDIQKITTINEMETNITRVPKTPQYLKGVINLRGEIIPIIDMRLKFLLPQVEVTEDTRIIIVKNEDIILGFIVDSVDDVVEFDEDSIESIAGFAGSITNEYLVGVGKIDNRIITLLNLEKLMQID
jgi:purine-binding chemotaxis protein CheW